VPGIIRNTVIDKVLGLSYRDWSKMQKDALEKSKQAAKLRQNTDSLNRKPNTKPSHALVDYTGLYGNPGYGNMEVALKHDTLFVHYNSTDEKTYLEHYHYDIFRVRSTDDDEDNGDATKIRFITNNKGDIGSLEAAMEPAVKDIVFPRLPPPFKVDKSELQKYVGDFVLNQTTAKFYLKGDSTLMLLVQGQPDYELVPTKKDEFDLKNVPGFSVKFEVNDKNQATAVSFIQPNGIFKATRK